MEKVNSLKLLAHIYSPGPREVQFVEVPSMLYLMIDGAGDPNTSQDYADAVEVLYAVSYTLKFAVKKAPGAVDYSVMPLEGLWWADGPGSLDLPDKSSWHWTSLIAQPDSVTADLVRAATDEVSRKKHLAATSKVRYDRLAEGLVGQVMHIGPYADEAPTIARLHAAIAEHGCEPTGRHHEIYLSDPRRADAAKLKTILRQPVKARQG